MQVRLGAGAFYIIPLTGCPEHLIPNVVRSTWRLTYKLANEADSS